MAIKYNNIFHCNALQNLTQIRIFDLKKCHLATLARWSFFCFMNPICRSFVIGSFFRPKIDIFSSLQQATAGQGCQMVSFPTKNPNLGTFCRTLQWKCCYIFLSFGNILRPLGYIIWVFGIFEVIWCIFPRFGILYREKFGNSGAGSVFSNLL
jgi:hypothetical protein